MNNAAFEPLARGVKNIHGVINIRADLQEICSFTLEICLLKTGAGRQEEGEELCPFTLEPVCMRTRAMSAGRD
jgi:hypothetical protein